MNIATFGGYGANKAAKQQASAANAMADAIENSAKKNEITTETEDVSEGEDVVNGAARRRYKLSDTRNKASSSSSLSGLRKTLG